MKTVELTYTDPIEILTERLSKVLSENNDLKTRVKALENKMQSVMQSLNTERNRGTIRPPFSGYFENLSQASGKAPSNTDYNSNQTIQTPSVIGYSSEDSYSVNQPTASVNTIMSMYGTARMSSATSAMGYTNKKSVWGAALSSMLISMVRYCCIKTGTGNLFLDESKIMKMCIYLAPVLYEMSHKELPSVKSPVTKYMSLSISRAGSNDVPQSTAESWYEMTKTQDGRDCLTVIEVMIKYCKRMPEILGHPLSNILPYIQFPVVRKKADGSVFFCISKMFKFTNGPIQWEKWCSLLKGPALIKYAKWRMTDNAPGISATSMMSEMKISELVEKKNTEKFPSVVFPGRTRPDSSYTT
ncbi:hypothetical protein E4U58_000822 [Claviceps cyperi]|nr:hypothetical protein E4U58_000822 [Claviceps cyperi]